MVCNISSGLVNTLYMNFVEFAVLGTDDLTVLMPKPSTAAFVSVCFAKFSSLTISLSRDEAPSSSSRDNSSKVMMSANFSLERLAVHTQV